MTKREAANWFRRAANLLEKDGWCRYSFRNAEGAHCTVGALRDTKQGDPDDSVSYFASKHAGKYAERRGLILWNDRKVKSGEEVIKLFRKCAYLLDHGAKL